MTNVLYVLKDDTQESRELRLSLRSLEKNCKDLGEIYICTNDLPDWIQNVKHIRCGDSWNEYPEDNVYDKVYEAVLHIKCRNFLFMNDDFYMMKPFYAKNYPYYYRGELVYIDNPSRWQEVNNKTIEVLKRDKVENVLDYGVHCPILYNRVVMRSLCRHYDNIRHGHCGVHLRSLYGNLLYGISAEKVNDCKLWHGEPLRESDTGCVSTNDGADDVLDKIEKIFNKKSKYEK